MTQNAHVFGPLGTRAYLGLLGSASEVSSMVSLAVWRTSWPARETRSSVSRWRTPRLHMSSMPMPALLERVAIWSNVYPGWSVLFSPPNCLYAALSAPMLTSPYEGRSMSARESHTSRTEA